MPTPDLRKDYFTNRVVIVAPRKRKLELPKKRIAKVDPKKCQFCPGNEKMTPLADLVLVSKLGTLAKLSDEPDYYVKGWAVRVFFNKFPAVEPDALRNYSDVPLYSEPAVGHHYIVVMTQKHTIDLTEIDEEQWVNVLTTVQDKSRWLYSKKNVAYVAIFLNHGEEAGASVEHPHLQMMSLPILPPTIEQEAKSLQKLLRERGICQMCNVIGKEAKGPRLITSTKNFIVFAPWASIHQYEFWIFPIAHQTSILRATQKEIGELASILRLSLMAMGKLLRNPSFNMVVHTSPEKKTSKQIHWHIEVYPRLSERMGVEIGTGVYVNRIPPEQAAKELSQVIDKLTNKK